MCVVQFNFIYIVFLLTSMKREVVLVEASLAAVYIYLVQGSS